MQTISPESAPYLLPYMKKHIGQHTSQRGFTLVELMIVLLVLGVLSALIYPTVSRSRDSGFDVVKKQNEKVLNADMLALYEAGVDTTKYATAADAIAALQGTDGKGISVPSTMSGGTPMVIRLDTPVNGAAYEYTPATTTTPGIFKAILAQRDVSPTK